MKVELKGTMGSDATICQIARTCYGNQHKDTLDSGLLKHLIKHKHVSVLEHASMRFSIEMPIFTARQFMRCRTYKPTEISRRYTNKRISFYESKKLPEYVFDFYEQSFQLYKDLVSSGIAKEDARQVLPQSTMIELEVTCDLNNFLKQAELRLSPKAQKEIRVIYEMMMEEVEKVFPETIRIWKEEILNSNEQN